MAALFSLALGIARPLLRLPLQAGCLAGLVKDRWFYLVRIHRVRRRCSVFPIAGHFPRLDVNRGAAREFDLRKAPDNTPKGESGGVRSTPFRTADDSYDAIPSGHGEDLVSRLQNASLAGQGDGGTAACTPAGLGPVIAHRKLGVFTAATSGAQPEARKALSRPLRGDTSASTCTCPRIRPPRAQQEQIRGERGVAEPGRRSLATDLPRAFEPRPVSAGANPDGKWGLREGHYPHRHFDP